MAAARFLVSGRVQGVFFRASTREQALRLRLCGYANNLHDGRVEVFAEGEAAALDQLEQWLRRGPPLARVDALQREPADAQGREGFVTG
ncbi:MAG: acylphosphatase [Rhodanobacteraceae bacterium]|nr:acylphosphatase [Rhodanobacteraceae bacterium]